jgi:hypothetical protein
MYHMPILEVPIQARRISMTRSLMYGLALVFASASRAQSPPIVGAVIQTWHLDSKISTTNTKMNLVTFRIVNTGKKDITAYNLSLTITYGTDKTQYQWGHDLVNDAVFLEKYKGTPYGQDFIREYGDGRIPVGGFRDEQIGVLPGLTDFNAVFEVVAYADKTAEATDDAAFQRLVDQRKAAAAAIQKADEILRDVASDPTVTTPHATAADRVQKLEDAVRAKPGTPDISLAQLTVIVHELQRTPAGTPKESLNTLIDEKEKARAIWVDQAQLVKIGGPQ